MKHIIECKEKHVRVLNLKLIDEYQHAKKSCSIEHEVYWLNQARVTQDEINKNKDAVRALLEEMRAEHERIVSNNHYKSEAMDYLDKSIRLNEELKYCLGQQDKENLSRRDHDDLVEEETALRNEIKYSDKMVKHYNTKIDWSL